MKYSFQFSLDNILAGTISTESEADGLRKYSENFIKFQADAPLLWWLGQLLRFLWKEIAGAGNSCSWCCDHLPFHSLLHLQKKSLFHYSSWSLTVSFRFWWDCRDCRFAKDHLNNAKGSISSMDRQEESLLRTALAAWKELRPQLGGVTQMLHDARECCFQTFTARRRVEQFWCGIERCLRVINRGKMWYIWSFVYLALFSNFKFYQFGTEDCQTVRAARGKKTVLLPKLPPVMLVTSDGSDVAIRGLHFSTFETKTRRNLSKKLRLHGGCLMVGMHSFLACAGWIVFLKPPV